MPLQQFAKLANTYMYSSAFIGNFVSSKQIGSE